jgi:superfamily II DNA or RNA helicase
VDTSGFINANRLLYGPWQAFERDVARLLLVNGYEDVRVVGGKGDQGADVLGVLRGELWVFQCKHTTAQRPPANAIDQVMEAAEFYEAKHMAVATSRHPGDSFLAKKARVERTGLRIRVFSPNVLLDLMENSPEYPPAKRKLREYQIDAAAKFREALVDTGRGQIVLATGLGKTIIMADVVADLLNDELVRNGRVLVLAHTRELVDQLERAFWFQLPKWVPTHRLAEGERPSYWEGIAFATVQSARSRLRTLPDFGLVLVDEAHHVGAPIFREVIETLDPPMLGGVTATPWRGDGYDIDQILGPALVKFGIADGLRHGFLSEVEYRVYADNLNWDFVQRSSHHQYSIGQLNRRLIIPKRDEQAASIIKEVYDEEGRHGGIIFSPSIVHAKEFAALLRSWGFQAEAISNENTPRERDRIMAKFRAGKLHFVATVDLFNEGVDVPDVDMIVFMRVTHNRRIFVQQLGRGLRVTPGKDRLIVLDFVSDLRRIAEVLELERAAAGEPVERLSMAGRIVRFSDESLGGFMEEWLYDQASLALREGDPVLEIPEFEFPDPPPPGGVQ